MDTNQTQAQRDAIAALQAAINQCEEAGLTVLGLGYNQDYAHPVESVEYDRHDGEPCVVLGHDDEFAYQLDYVDEE